MTTTTAPAAGALLLRTPVAADGSALNSLVSKCPPLDPNSVYCNLLHCTHFAGTSVAAQAHDGLAGFISAYLVPSRTDTLFVWQVAVAPDFRGQGLATRMMHTLLARQACARVRYVETTVTDTNLASLSLFAAFAKKHKAELTSTPHFDKDLHFNGRHESERLLRIGPLA
jgi:L-2,4-diaminobutyric acid acetyltransferase